MSMLCNFVAVTPDDLDGLIRDPSEVFEVFFPNGGESLPEHGLDIEKTWHGLHYILTGSPWEGDPPLSKTILGGTEIGEDTGYGPPRYLTPAEVVEVSAALEETTHEMLAARYDSEAMNKDGIYPQGWDAGGLEWLLDAFDRVAGFYGKAAANGRAMLICLS